MSKAQVWAIVKAITSCLNSIVLACVMNQSRSYWLLSDALTMIITFTINMEATLFPFSSGLEIFYSFESEIIVLLWLKVIKVIKPFFAVFEKFRWRVGS
jgi:hypothetical protein